MDKYLWCPRCKGLPDEVKEILSFVIIKRTWSEEEKCYEAQDLVDGEQDCTKCGVCDTKLLSLEDSHSPEIEEELKGVRNVSSHVSP